MPREDASYFIHEEVCGVVKGEVHLYIRLIGIRNIIIIYRAVIPLWVVKNYTYEIKNQ